MRGVPSDNAQSCSNSKMTTAPHSDRYVNAARNLNYYPLGDAEDMCQRKITVAN